MSRDTEEALREAIIAHSRDEGRMEGAELLADWIVVYCTIQPDSETANGYDRLLPLGQAYHRSVGLLHGAIEDFTVINLQYRDRDG